MICGYDRRLVWDYINGCYIDNIDELENDYKFMIDVIRITRNKNMYNLCSDEIKSNYEFVTFMIEIFSDDKKFVDKIAKEYLNNVNEDDITFKELIFIMCNVFDKCRDNYDCLMYFVKRAVICTCERVAISSIIDKNEELNIKKMLGKGFILYQTSEFGRSEIMIKHMAKILLDEIFYENNNINIEELIHNRFSSLDKLNKYGIKNFIFSYVREFDLFLASYITANMDLISDIEKNIIRVKNNWSNYINRVLDRKRDIFMQESFALIEEYKPKYTHREICVYIDNLNILPILLEDTEYEDDIEIINVKNMNLNDYICINKIVELAKELYLSPIINTSVKIDEYYSDKKYKILKFNPKNVEDN